MSFTFMYLYYNNKEAIANLEKIGCQDYPINFLFVDDGSKEPLKLDWKNAKIIRIEEDIPWGMPRANNIGFRELAGETVMRLDIDHYFLKEDIDQLLEISNQIKPDKIFKFMRTIHKGNETTKSAPPPNIYMAQVNTIVKSGGYNERFCGNYGHEDSELMYRLAKKKITTTIFENPKVHVAASLGTKGLNRDTSINKKLFEELKNSP